jgi:ribose transport system permease protein
MGVVNSVIASIRKINLRDQWMLSILLFLVLAFSVFGSGFLSGYNIQTIIIYNTEIMLIAVGELFTIIMGNIDISVGSVLGLSGIIGSIVMREAYANNINQLLSIILGFSAGLGTGALC